MSTAELSEQLNLTSIRDHGWHMQVTLVVISLLSFYCIPIMFL